MEPDDELIEASNTATSSTMPYWICSASTSTPANCACGCENEDECHGTAAGKGGGQ
jgi:hypothetical protein